MYVKGRVGRAQHQARFLASRSRAELLSGFTFLMRAAAAGHDSSAVWAMSRLDIRSLCGSGTVSGLQLALSFDPLMESFRNRNRPLCPGRGEIHL